MKYKVTYLRPKKKGYSKQIATFYNIEDASHYEYNIKERGCIQTEIYPIFAEEF